MRNSVSLIAFAGFMALAIWGYLNLYESKVKSLNQSRPTVTSALPIDETRAGADVHLPERQPGVEMSTQPMDDFTATVETARRASPSLHSLNNDYHNFSERDLEHVLEKSNRKIKAKQLFEKSNKGALSREETRILITEVRRQAVIHGLLARAKLAEFKKGEL